MKKKFYASETKEAMQMFAATLNERDFRRYAAVEALRAYLKITDAIFALTG